MATAESSVLDMDVVYLIDDDESMRSSLVYVLSKAGFRVESFSSPQSFLEDYSGGDCGCLVLDLEMPGMTGLELAQKLQDKGFHSPFIVLTGYGTIATAVDAMRLGATDFIEKPFEHNRLIDCISKAQKGRLETKVSESFTRIDLPENLLTLRERQIMLMVIDGVLTKQIASSLSISTKTVDVHRSNIMKKLGVSSVAQLVKKVIKSAS